MTTRTYPPIYTDVLMRLKDGGCFIYSQHCSPGAARQSKYLALQRDPDLILIRMSYEDAYRAVHGA